MAAPQADVPCESPVTAAGPCACLERLFTADGIRDGGGCRYRTGYVDVSPPSIAFSTNSPGRCLLQLNPRSACPTAIDVAGLDGARAASSMSSLEVVAAPYRLRFRPDLHSFRLVLVCRPLPPGAFPVPVQCGHRPLSQATTARSILQRQDQRVDVVARHGVLQLPAPVHKGCGCAMHVPCPHPGRPRATRNQGYRRSRYPDLRAGGVV